MTPTLLTNTDSGLYCAAGDFYIDPWRPVERAVITHAHADHARPGMGSYLAAVSGSAILRARLGDDAHVETIRYGESKRVGAAQVSLHPAGHILGSSQVRVEVDGEVWVVSGDYKTAPDPTCDAFKPLRCDVFVTEATFALPIYRWKSEEALFAEINEWWQANRAEGRASILFCYALGKAQRILARIDAEIGPIYTHGAIERLTQIYRDQGIVLATTQNAIAASKKDFAGSLILAPPSARGTPWIRRFGESSTGFASGWMQIRGTRRRKAVDRGFALSDHADWPGLLNAIQATAAETVWITHGQSEPLARLLAERGLSTQVIRTQFEGELDEEASSEEVEESGP